MSLFAWTLLGVLLEAGIPPLTGRVVDTAGILSASERSALEQKLALIEQQTSVQIVVATIPSLEDEPIEDYGIRLAEKWRIGQKGLDNGAIIIVARDERRVRIEVGYGLEPVIPDGLAGRIIRERITPAFRRGDYAGGLAEAIDGLSLAARREYPADSPEPTGRGGGAPRHEPEESGSRAGRVASDNVFILGLAFIGFVVIGVLGNALGWWVAAGSGAVAGPGLLMLAGASSPLLWFAVPAGAILGLFAMGFLRSMGKHQEWDSGTHRGRGPRGGGYWGGGWSGGGGGGFGGGFGGGGGRFGGGGASGGW